VKRILQMKERMLFTPNKFSFSFWVWIRKGKILLMVREKSSSLINAFYSKQVFVFFLGLDSKRQNFVNGAGKIIKSDNKL